MVLLWCWNDQNCILWWLCKVCGFHVFHVLVVWITLMFKMLFYGYFYYDFNLSVYFQTPHRNKGLVWWRNQRHLRKGSITWNSLKVSHSLSSCKSDIMLQDVILRELSTFLTPGPIVRNSIQRPHDFSSFLWCSDLK